MPFTLWDILAAVALVLLIDRAFARLTRHYQRRAWTVLQVTPEGHCVLHCFQSTQDGRKLIHSQVDLNLESQAVARAQEKAVWN